MNYLKLEHNLLESFKEHNFKSKIIVCTSGGVDSVSLLTALNSLKKQLNLSLKSLFIHHGYGEDESQNNYRDQAAIYVRKLCNESDIEFLSNFTGVKNLDVEPAVVLNSEAELRLFRENIISEYAKKFPDFKFAFAHHAQDLLENRLIQMLRGTSAKGFLSMKIKNQVKIRPLLLTNKEDILKYASIKKIEYIKDPSNANTNYLRNWLRQDLLPKIEAYRQGSVKTLSRSLQNIAEELSNEGELWSEQWSKVYNAERRFLNLSQLLLLSSFEQRKCIAELLSLEGVLKFSRNQLNEVLKRLDSVEKIHKFEMMGLEWNVRADELNVCKK